MGPVVCTLFVLACVTVQTSATPRYHQHHEYDYTGYADEVVWDWIQEEVERSDEIARSADAAAQRAREAWQAAQRRPKPRPENHYKYEKVEQLRKTMDSLEQEKKYAEQQKDAAHKKMQEYVKREEQMALRLSEAKQRAMSAKKIAEARSREATQARQAATAAATRAQESQVTDFIPPGMEQTQVINIQEVRRLAQEADFAENMARVAMADADKYDREMVEMAKQATAVWVAATKATEEHSVKAAAYKAKCDALANTKAVYRKALMDYNAYQKAHKPEGKTLEELEHHYHKKAADAAKYWAVNKAFRHLYRCAGVRPTGNQGGNPVIVPLPYPGVNERGNPRGVTSPNRPNRGPPSGGRRRVAPNPSTNRGPPSGGRRRVSSNRVANRGGSSEERGRASSNRAANRGGSSEETRASPNRVANRGGSSEEGRQVSLNRATNRSGSRSRARSPNRGQSRQRPSSGHYNGYRGTYPAWLYNYGNQVRNYRGTARARSRGNYGSSSEGD